MQVVMAPNDGKALMVFSMTTGNSFSEAIQSTLEGLDLKPEENRTMTVNGMPVNVTLSKQVIQDQNTGQQNTNMVLSFFIDYNKNYYVFHGLTSEADYITYSPMFEKSMHTFSELTNPVILNKKPAKILIKRVQSPGTLADAFKYYGISPDRMEELALLNNLSLTERVNTGKLIKVLGQ